MFGAPSSTSTHARLPSWVRPLLRRWGGLIVFLVLSLMLFGLYQLSAVEVQLTMDGETTDITTHAGTVRDLLVEQAVPVESGDLVLPGPNARVEPDTHVIVQRARPARVRADGSTVMLRSHGRSALALLTEAGVSLAPDDVITVNGQPWQVDRTLPVNTKARLGDAAGTQRDAVGPPREAAGSPREAAGSPREAAQVVSPFPLIRPAMAAEPDDAEHLPEPSSPTAASANEALLPGADREWVVDVWRAAPVTVVEGDTRFVLQLAGPTIGDALHAAGIDVYPQDEVWPRTDTRLDGQTRVVIERATPFVVEADGNRTTVRAVAKTVGDGLSQAGLGLLGHDYAIPAADTPLSNGLEVKVIRVKEDILVREVPIGFATQFQGDSSMVLDNKRVDRAGEPGLKSQRIRITYEDGEEIDREIIEEIVLREPVSEIVSYGTDVVWNTVSTPKGPLRYWRKMRVYATSYSLTRSGTSPNAPWYGLTRSGLPMRHGIVAVDRRFIPFMSNLYVPEYGVGLAADTGGGIKSYHIDLGYDDDNYQSWHWPVDLYLLEPLPEEDKMIWLLP